MHTSNIIAPTGSTRGFVTCDPERQGVRAIAMRAPDLPVRSVRASDVFDARGREAHEADVRGIEVGLGRHRSELRGALRP